MISHIHTVYTNNILTLFGKIMSKYGEFQFENLDAQVIDTGINKYVFLSGTASIIIVYQMSIWIKFPLSRACVTIAAFQFT